jgi:nitroimidazol reductase NimA-like FMN-containing flavoprotein (pyridoxamine 5'-phosphate oxidase superfamily)
VMCRDGELYAVHINHAHADGRLHFHCAPEGKKLDMIRANRRVCYVVNRDFREARGAGRARSVLVVVAGIAERGRPWHQRAGEGTGRQGRGGRGQI